MCALAFIEYIIRVLGHISPKLRVSVNVIIALDLHKISELRKKQFSFKFYTI